MGLLAGPILFPSLEFLKRPRRFGMSRLVYTPDVHFYTATVTTGTTIKISIDTINGD